MALTYDDYVALAAERTPKELVDIYANACAIGQEAQAAAVMHALKARMNLWTAVVWGSTHVAKRDRNGVITISEREDLS